MYILDIEMVRAFYGSFQSRLENVRKALERPLTYAEKVFYTHLFDSSLITDYKRGADYAEFKPDRVAMQDATAQMALLQFMNAGKDSVAVPSSVHCDHLVRADLGAMQDISKARNINSEVYDFLASASNKYNIGFWGPGSGIIHQVVLENYAFPGGMMVGTDSHTPNAGGLGMVAIGVGGADAVDVMVGMPWELKMPKLIGVHLTGRLSGWASPKDVILNILGKLTVKGGTNAVLEYFGSGVSSISATGRATICNMGAELGATCSIFPYDYRTEEYLCHTGRGEVAELCRANADLLKADAEVTADPHKYYDSIIELDLNTIKPHLNGPFTPDAATPVSQMKEKAIREGWPLKVEVGLIGSCTNSSYEDMSRAASIVRQALDKNIQIKGQLIINPGSEQIRHTAERDGILDTFRKAGALIMANACGPCIGQWHRHTDDPIAKNAIVTSFNRNFRSRADGNPNTFAFIGSPEMTVALAISGRLDFDPTVDRLTDRDGNEVLLDAPHGDIFPPNGFAVENTFFTAPTSGSDDVVIRDGSDRLQRLVPFQAWDGKDLVDMPLLIKTSGKCTTDHISMAGPWLRFRGHLANISDNLLMGATNAFNGETNTVRCQLDGSTMKVSEAAKAYKAAGLYSVVVAEDNYGEGSSREHAAMEPRFLNVKAIVAKSFARIHETNLKKQGMLALTFAEPADYDKVREDDRISLKGIKDFAPGRNLTMVLKHADGSEESFPVCHTYNETQIGWFRAGSALNYKAVTVPYIEGDGVGKEIMPVCQAVVDASVARAYRGTRRIDWKEVLAGGKSYELTGEWLPQETLDTFSRYKIGIKGPLMTPVGGGIRSLNVALRQTLDLYVCQRPVRYLKGIESPVKHPENVDMCIFRENTEDIYAGIEWETGSDGARKLYGFLRDEMGVNKVRFPETSAFGVKPVSREGSERLIRSAIEYALAHGRKTVTLVHKGNIMKFTEGGFKKWGYELAEREFGEYLADGRLVINDCICDAFLQNALLKPQDYSVIATLNLNGDYISDMLAAQVGGIGIAPGANINYQTGHAIFEATHGIAPDIAGQNKANPCSLILSGVMMLEFMGWNEAARLIEDALERLFSEGYATEDLARFMENGKILGTKEFGEMLVKNV